MKNILKKVVFIGLLSFSNLYAQKVSIKYKQEEKVDTKTSVAYSTSNTYLTGDDKFYYEKVDLTKLKDSKKILIKKINKSTKEKVWEKLLPVDAYTRSTNSYFCGIEKVTDGFLVFMKHENSSKKQSYLATQLFDEEFIKKGEEKIVNYSDYRSEGMIDPYTYNIIRKGNIFLVYGKYYFKHDLKNKPCSFALIDDQQNMIWEKKIEFPKNQIFALKKADLTEDLSLNVLFVVSTNGKSITDHVATIEYKVAYYNHSKNDFKMSEPINFENRFNYLGDELFSFNAKKLIVFGQYHRTAKDKGYEGIFCMQLDLEKMENDFFQMIPYSKQMLEQMTTKRDFDKGNLPSNYVIKSRYTNTNKEITYFLEHQYSTYTSKPGGTSRSYYGYSTIVLIKTNPKGEVIWFKTIEREASDIHSKYTPARSFYVNENILLLFNASAASAKNPSQTNGYTYSEYENALVAMMYDKDGNLISQDYFIPKVSEGTSCNIPSIEKIDDNTVDVTFDKTDKTFMLKSITPATLTIE